MQQTETEEEDPRQPSKEAKKIYMYWNDSNTKAWTHFADNDTSSLEEYFEEKENGEIKIDLQFRMDPILDKRLLMDTDGLFRGSFNINVQGDWTNDNEAATACGQNDCEELNITLLSGPNVIGEHHETGSSQEITPLYSISPSRKTPSLIGTKIRLQPSCESRNET